MCASHRVRPNKLKHHSLEQREFIARLSKENRWLMLRIPKLFDGSRERVFIGKIWGEGYSV